MMNVCEHGDHEAPEGKRFCSPECEACEHNGEAEAVDGCANLCGRREPVDIPHCVMCNAEMPVACGDCTDYAFDAVGAPKKPTPIDALREKLEADKMVFQKRYDDGEKDPYRYRYSSGRVDQIDAVLDFLKK